MFQVVVRRKFARLLLATCASIALGVATMFLLGVLLPYVYLAVTSGLGSGSGDLLMYLMMLTVPVAAVTSVVLGLILIPFFYDKFTPPGSSS